MMQAILHIILAASIFLSTTGVAIIRHFCHNELKNVSVMVDMKDCKMEAVAVPSCHRAEPMSCCAKAHQKPQVAKTDCCSTKIIFLKLSDQFNYQKIQELRVPLFSLVSKVIELSAVTEAADLHSNLSALIHSPPRPVDIRVFTGSFLL